MEIKKKYYAEYLHNVAIEQIAENYRNEGFIVKKRAAIGDYKADLIVKKNSQNIVIEVKTGELSPRKKRNISGLADYIQSLGNYKFKVAIAKLPKEKELKIEGLEDLISNYFSENYLKVFHKLPYYITFENVSDIILNKLVVSNENLNAEGSGIISLKLQKNKNNISIEEHFSMNEDIPFKFKISFPINKNLNINQLSNFDIDTSSFEE